MVKKNSSIYDKKKQPDKLKSRPLKAGAQKFLTELLPYHFTPSFVEHNGKSMSILQLYVRQGTNRNLAFDDVISFIPSQPIKGVEMHVMSVDTLMKHEEKKRVIRKNASINKSTLESDSREKKKKNADNAAAKEIRQSEFEDYSDYESILDSAEPVVVFKWLLVVTGPDRQSVDDQISDINTKLDQYHEGARWDALAGDQKERFTELFGRMDRSRHEMTSTGSMYAGLNLAVNSGLSDATGLPIGNDVLSLSGSTSYFDFEGSTLTQAMIATPKSTKFHQYIREKSTSQQSASSMIAQLAANQAVFNKKRVHHLVLNDFDYFEKGLYFLPIESPEIFQRYDVSQLTINPLQGFGEIEDVVNIYARLIEKIINIFDILLRFGLTTEDRGILSKVLSSFYIENNLWSNEADRNPYTTQLVGRKNNATYPTMAHLLNSFITYGRQAMGENRETKADKIEALQSILSQAMSAHMGVLGRTTSIEPTNAPQVYYDFRSIESTVMKQVQLVNIIDYIIYTAKPGDLIVIHGFDTVLTRVADMLLDSIEAAKKSGIRFLFVFDSVQAPNLAAGKMNDMFEMQDKYYTDLDTDVDWVIIGKSRPEEVKLFQTALNKDLSMTIENMMQSKNENQILVHRSAGDVNNFVQASFII